MRWRAAFRKAAEKVRAAFPDEEKKCPGCGEELSGLPPMAEICRDCADLLADGISSFRLSLPDGLGLPLGFYAIRVAPDDRIGALPLRLMESGKASRKVLATAYAHAIPLGEYMLTDGVYLSQEATGDTSDPSRALARAVASAFACSYRGFIREDSSFWQEEALARYSQGAAKRRASQAYPVVLMEDPKEGGIAALATRLERAGAERMMVISIPVHR